MTAFDTEACLAATANPVQRLGFKHESAGGIKLLNRSFLDLSCYSRTPTDAYSYCQWLVMKLSLVRGPHRQQSGARNSLHELKSRRGGVERESFPTVPEWTPDLKVEPFLRTANREPVRLGHNGFPQPSRGILAL